MRPIAALALAILLAGCAAAPEHSTWERVNRSMYHADHPEHGRPITIAHQPADFTGSTAAITPSAKAALQHDADDCWEGAPRGLTESMRYVWACLWLKGWRWDTDQPPAWP